MIRNKRPLSLFWTDPGSQICLCKSTCAHKNCIDLNGYPRCLVLGKVPSPKCERIFTKQEEATEDNFPLLLLCVKGSPKRIALSYAYTRVNSTKPRWDAAKNKMSTASMTSSAQQHWLSFIASHVGTACSDKLKKHTQKKLVLCASEAKCIKFIVTS